jgi:hypothetical protein
MNYKKLEEKYFKFFNEIQYKGKNSYFTNFYHTRMEKGFDDVFFQNILEVGDGGGQHLNFVKCKFDFYKITDLVLPNLIPSVVSKISDMNKNDIKVSVESQEGVGFEPTRSVNPFRFSRPVPSATRRALQNNLCMNSTKSRSRTSRLFLHLSNQLRCKTTEKRKLQPKYNLSPRWKKLLGQLRSINRKVT